MEAFRRYELRTTEVDQARQFYAELLGHDRAIVWPLHEQARARGAVPHWLGSIGLADLEHVERVRDEMLRRGAASMGPVFETRDGRHAGVLRDPGGAIVGLTTVAAEECDASSVDVSWHVLNTNDVATAIADYEAVFGWTIAARPSTGPYGSFHTFSWGGSESSAGAMSDLAGRPEVHPHWLFFLNVASVDSAVEWSRGAGGTATEPVETPSGERIAICEDPQGAAFGVMEC